MVTELTDAWADLDTVLDELRSAGTPEAPLSVDQDPAKVIVPGVWVKVTHVTRRTLAHHIGFQLRLHMIAADTEDAVARDQLAQLYGRVLPVLDTYGGPTGAAELVAVAMPAGGSPLPAIVVPVDIETE